MKGLLRDEPVRVVAAIQATLALLWIIASQFGWKADPELIAGVELAVAAWLAVVTRSQVTPWRL